MSTLLSFDNLDAHIEHALMEGDVDIEVNVGEEALAEAADEAIEEQAEIDEPVAEAAETEAEGEAVEMRFQQIDHMIHVFQTRGVSRDNLMAFSYGNDSLAQMIEQRCGTIVSLESMDATGDPNSSITIAALEGLGEMAKKAWEWIKKIFGKIMAFMGRLFSALVTRFGRADKSIGRLRKEYQDRTNDDKAAKDSKKKVFAPAKLEAYDKAILTAETLSKSQDIKVLLKAKISKTKDGTPKDIGTQSKDENTVEKRFSKLLESCDKARTNVKEGKVEIAKVTWAMCGDYLKKAITVNESIRDINQNIKEAKDTATFNKKEAERLQNVQLDGDNGEAIKAAREVTSRQNKIASCLAKCASHYVGLQSMLLSTLNARIMLGKKA